MATKRSAPSRPSDTEPKRQRKTLTISKKVELLDMLKEGRSYAAVGRHYGINESSVCYIKKEENNIRTTAAMSFNKTAKRVITSRNKPIVRMESALALWISDCRKKNIPLDTIAICTKAKTLYETFAEKAGPLSASPTRPTLYNASKGWFDKFQKRFGLKSVSLHGEAASADRAGAAEYVNDTFKTTIEEGEYKPEQVFNMGEMGLFWKRMRSVTQPMDHGIIRAFKALYTRKALQNLVEAMDSDEDFSLKAYWHEYTIASCLLNIQRAIKETKSETLNACWKNLGPEVVHDYKGSSPDEVHHSAVDKAMKLAKLLGGDGFSDMTADDVFFCLHLFSLFNSTKEVSTLYEIDAYFSIAAKYFNI
uniref:HTH CENPB-type domain-containing protein n=1 Tax=Amphiprion ocellaris TaxID=80972 RepID=A0AAQ6AN34_AMPOC